MRWSVVAGAGVLGMGWALIGFLDAGAQQFSTPPQPVSNDVMQDASDTPATHRMQGWVHGQPPQPGALALLYTAPDRALTQADVAQIAQAYLLWHGNHDWRVVNLATDGDRVTFAIATSQHIVVAAFAMDRHTGALTRTG